MPISVHCPNPACAKVHQVKNKYAGMRGKCPACDSWMYVPTVGMMPSMAVARPAELGKTDPWDQPELGSPYKPDRKPAPARATPIADEDEGTGPIPVKPAPRKGKKAPVVQEPADTDPDAGDEKPAKKKHFSWVAILLLLLGMVSLGLFAAAPFLPGPEVQASGDLAKDLSRPEPVSPDSLPLVAGAAGAVAFLALLSILFSLLLRRMGFLSKFLVYLGVLGASALLLIGLSAYRTESANIAKIRGQIENFKSNAENRGDGSVELGQQHLALAAGAGGACFCFVLAGVFMHRRWWSRLLGFMMLLFIPALAVVWVYHPELGIDKDLLPGIPDLKTLYDSVRFG